MARPNSLGSSGGTIKTLTTTVSDQSHKTRCQLTGPGITRETIIYVRYDRLQQRIAEQADKGLTLSVPKAALAAEIQRFEKVQA